MKPNRVELLNVPLYHQGAHDGLCAYYSTAMMLAALYPKFVRDFGEVGRSRGRRRRTSTNGMLPGTHGDPIIRNYSNRRDPKEILAMWFYEGEYVKKARIILNRIMKEENFKTRFDFKEKTARESTFREITESIDIGLPVMLGWDTEDFGCHAVLVTGYWHGNKKWFLLNDPGGDSEVCWENLKEDKNSNFEVVTCRAETYRGPRPDKSITFSDGTDTIFRWTPDQDYVPIDEHFAS